MYICIYLQAQFKQQATLYDEENVDDMQTAGANICIHICMCVCVCAHARSMGVDMYVCVYVYVYMYIFACTV
jgi:hypothetical protein